MTWSDTMPTIEEICCPTHAGDWWKDEGSPNEIWLRCDRCNRPLGGPPSASLGEAAARGLAAGWAIKRAPGQSMSVDNGAVTIREIIDLAQMFCRRCSSEFLDV